MDKNLMSNVTVKFVRWQKNEKVAIGKNDCHKSDVISHIDKYIDLMVILNTVLSYKLTITSDSDNSWNINSSKSKSLYINSCCIVFGVYNTSCAKVPIT